VPALADGVQAEFRVAARPGGFGVEAGQLADAPGDAEGPLTAAENVVDRTPAETEVARYRSGA